MDLWLSLTFEFGALALLGTAYYFFQRRRILRSSREQIVADLEEFQYQLNQFMEDSKGKDSYQKVCAFVQGFEMFYKAADFQALTSMDSNILDSELKSFYDALSGQILSHIKINKVL